MITPGTYNFTIYRGSTDPFSFSIKDSLGAPLAFDEVRLTISQKTAKEPGAGLILRKSTDVLDDYDSAPLMTHDEYSGVITWTPTPVESRLIPIGEKAKYEVELRNGASQIIYLVGTITGIGGINDD